MFRTKNGYGQTGQVIYSRVAIRGFNYYRQNALISDICDIHCIYSELCRRLHHDLIGYRIILIAAITWPGVIHRMSKIITNVFMSLPLSM